MDVRFVDPAGGAPQGRDDVVDLLVRDDGFAWRRIVPVDVTD